MGRPLEEHELVERARSGDAGAYAALVRVHEEIAFRTAYLITQNAADAEEAAQEGFVKAYRALGRFRTGEPLRPWLLTIVANEARNRRRSAGRRTALAVRAAGEEHRSGEAAPSPEAALLAGERRAELLGALAKLGEDDRLVIGCRLPCSRMQRALASAARLNSCCSSGESCCGLSALRYFAHAFSAVLTCSGVEPPPSFWKLPPRPT